MSTCTAPECERPTRSSGSPYCEMHYYRLRRNGTLETVVPRVPDAQCWAPDCTARAFHVNGLCRNCKLRHDRNGTFEHRNHRHLHHKWLDTENLNYTAIHQRVRKWKGKASAHPCRQCGSQAKHWAYNHQDTDEKVGRHENGSLVPFGTSTEYYEPYCVPCHKRMDLQRLKERNDG